MPRRSLASPLHDRRFGLISNTSKYLARGHLFAYSAQLPTGSCAQSHTVMIYRHPLRRVGMVAGVVLLIAAQVIAAQPKPPAFSAGSRTG